LSKPFVGFIHSSLELFAELKREGIAISPPLFIGGVSEVYPGHIWTILSRGQQLQQKSTEPGRLTRRAILEVLGVAGLPTLPTHDQNDAAIAAVMAAAADKQVEGITTALIGDALTIDSGGELREGPMVIPQIDRLAAARIADALRECHTADSSVAQWVEPAIEPQHVGAEELLAYFIDKAAEGEPQVCTYGWAYRALFGASYTKFSMAYARKAIGVAIRTRPRELPGLGLVRLDTFIVAKKDGFPSDGYWPAAHHDREEWERTLGNARVLD
jgi:hypothetical protein